MHRRRRWWLVIEDDDVDVMALERGLRELGEPVGLSVVPNGFDPVGHFDVCCSEQSDTLPELIVLDINLPLASGHEVLESLKAYGPSRSVPTIVLSTSDHEADLQRAYWAGAAGYFVKPPDFTDFVKTLETVLRYWSASAAV